MHSGKTKFTFFLLILAIALGLDAWAVKAASAGGRKNITNSKDGSELILIPAGEFLMGTPEKEGYDNEHPRRRVNLSAYYIGKYEVTNEQYARFVEKTRYQAQGNWRDYSTSGRKKHPVVCVTWKDAVAYCKWAGLRLPTEAEWEKAARGTDGRIYPWGNKWEAASLNWSGPKDKKWKSWEAQGSLPTLLPTKPIGSFPYGASSYGIMDMAGNVWEWCSDWYSVRYYQNSPTANPRGPDKGESKVLRGSSWSTSDLDCLRSANRNWSKPSGWDDCYGFRCAR